MQIVIKSTKGNAVSITVDRSTFITFYKSTSTQNCVHVNSFSNILLFLQNIRY